MCVDGCAKHACDENGLWLGYNSSADSHAPLEADEFRSANRTHGNLILTFRSPGLRIRSLALIRTGMAVFDLVLQKLEQTSTTKAVTSLSRILARLALSASFPGFDAERSSCETRVDGRLEHWQRVGLIRALPVATSASEAARGCNTRPWKRRGQRSSAGGNVMLVANDAHLRVEDHVCNSVAARKRSKPAG